MSKPDLIALSRCCNPSGTDEENCDLLVSIDSTSHSALVVIRVRNRVRSWWSSRRSAEATLSKYRAVGLAPTIDIPEPLMHVLERRWPEVEALRSEIRT